MVSSRDIEALRITFYPVTSHLHLHISAITDVIIYFDFLLFIIEKKNNYLINYNIESIVYLK